MSERSKFQLAALACAAMPSITVAGVRDAGPSNAPDSTAGIDQAIVLDATGRQYDVFASSTDAGRKRLQGRVRAARTLAESREPGGLGFGLDQVAAFQDGTDGKGSTGLTAVMVINHLDGVARNLDLLTLDDCSAMGTAIGAIHRLPAALVQPGGYPVFGTAQIHSQLTGWIKRLRSAGHIPPEITSSWARIIDTEGLWAFGTCFVHGGFVDGDVLYSGSTITAVTNWQGMQVNDPARDLAWIFAKLDEEHRNAVLAAYGRMMGSRLDDLIMLRANLWLQMEQVGDFIQALNRADNVKIMQFKAQVDRLAHQLGVATQKSQSAPVAPVPMSATAAAAGLGGAAGQSSTNRQDGVDDGYQSPSTITVGTLLHESERRLAQAAAQAKAQQAARQSVPANQRTTNAAGFDATGDMDRTGSASVNAVAAAGTYTTASSQSDPDSTEDSTPTSTPQSYRPPQTGQSAAAWSPSSTPTQAISPTEAHAMFATAQSYSSEAAMPIDASAPAADEAPKDQLMDAQPHAYRSQPYQDRLHADHAAAAQDQDAQTVLIPLLEQEERALRDAQLGLASRTGITQAVANSSPAPVATGSGPVATGTGSAVAANGTGAIGMATASTAGSAAFDDNDDTGESTPKA